MAAAVGMIAGCQKPEMVQIATPENVVAPVLEAVEGPVEITPTNLATDTLAFTWSLADYGVLTQVNYSIEAATAAKPDAKVTITSGVTADTTALRLNSLTAKVSYEDLNAVLLFDLGLNDGVAENVLFTIGAKVGEYQKIYSNSVTVSCKVTAAEKTYPMIYMPGSYQGWAPADAATKFQVLYDFAGNGVFEGIADFGTSPDEARAWKFTTEPDWDFDWGVPKGETPEAEAAEIKLINNDGGDRDNIAAYTAKRFYHFSMDTNTGLLKNNYSFDQVGVVGEITGWADGADKVMEFNAAKRRFYVDVEGLKGMFKFRLDGAWSKNWGATDFGVEVSNGDGNLEAEEGNYRVYLYLSNPAELAYELNAGMYGKEEPVGGTTTPEPEPEPEVPAELVGWGLVGEFSGWADGADQMLTSDGTYLVAKGVELSGQFKFRKDGKWDTNFGATGDVEPFALTANAETELVANGKNFTIAEGTYDVYLDEANAKAWFINDGSYPGGAAAPVVSIYGVIGVNNDWSNDIMMYEVDGLYVAYNVTFTADGGFKVRKAGAWDDTANFGLETQGNVEVDHAYDVITSGGSANLMVAAGTYDIWFDLENMKVYIMTPGKPVSEAEGGVVDTPDPSEQTWYMVGNFNEWNPADETYKMTAEGDYFVFKSFTAAEGCEAKFAPGAWNGDKGGDGTFAANTACPTGGSNIAVAAGTYDVYLKTDLSVYYFMTPGSDPGETPAVDPWETAASFANGEDATDDALMKEIRAYADADNLYVRVTAVAALEGANYLDVSFCDGNGTSAVWWGWTTTGTNTYWKEHKGSVDAEGNLTSMQYKYNDEYKDIAVKSEKSGDDHVWTLTYPREYVASFEANGKIYVSSILWKDYDPYWAVPARGNAMLEVTLP